MGQFGPNITGRRYFADIIRPSSTGEKKRKIRAIEWVSSFLTAHQHIIGYSVPYNGLEDKGYYTLQSNSRSPMSVPIESPYDFLLVITNWHPVSYRFEVIADYCSNFGHFAVFIPSCDGLRGNVHCSSYSYAHWKVRSGLLIRVNWTLTANANQPIENRLTFNRPTCYSRLADITCTTKLINTVARLVGHIWTFAHHWVKHKIFAVLKVWLICRPYTVL